MPDLCNIANYSMISIQNVPYFWHFLQNLLLQLHLAHFLLVDLFLHLGSCRLKLLHFCLLFRHFFCFFLVVVEEVVLGVVIGIGVGAGVGGAGQSRISGTEKRLHRGCTKKSRQTFYVIPKKWLILESKVKLEVKTIGQEL